MITVAYVGRSDSDIVSGGHVIIRARLDEDDQIVEAIGDMADYVDDLERWGNKTGNALINRLGRTCGVVKYERDILEPITTEFERKRLVPPPARPPKVDDTENTDVE